MSNENYPNIHEVLDVVDLPKENCIIKVIGVGGGGGNAVNHMYRNSIHDVTFVLCNTDRQALNNSPVPVHIQLGKEGLGAGNIPEVARKAAEESIDDIRGMLNDGTKMSFITAGMGGGTGTGAAPVIARISKELGILTVGIVTIPFCFEGANKIDQALDGVEEMAKHVDALLVINNERLRQIYPDVSVLNAFARADDTLNIAVRSITEIITFHGLINLDFNDVRTVLKDGGVAIMSTGYGEGEGRVKKAIKDALTSPLLNDNDVFNSKKILLNISFSEDKENEGLMMEEMNEVHNFMAKFGSDYRIKWGLANTQVDSARMADEEDHLIKLIKRREDYYGKTSSTPYKARPYIYIFKQEDLDNEDIILAVESSTTAHRSRKSLERICQISNGDLVSAASADAEDIRGTDIRGTGNLIRFV